MKKNLIILNNIHHKLDQILQKIFSKFFLLTKKLIILKKCVKIELKLLKKKKPVKVLKYTLFIILYNFISYFLFFKFLFFFF